VAEPLRSDRLNLRPPVVDDAAAFACLLGCDEAGVMMTAEIPWPVTEEAERDWLAQRGGPDDHAYAIERRATGDLVGCIGLIGASERPELGYWIGRDHRGQGYATEAGRLIVGLARRLGAQGLTADAFPENAASARVLAKLGFISAGTVERDLPMRGGMRTLCHFELDLTH